MIQIDMPMPDNCLECRFNTSEFGYCNAMPVEFVGQVNDFEEDGKPEWCPLKAQEPRVMTLEEIKALPDYVFLEDRDISHAFSIKTISRPALPQLVFVNTNSEECIGFRGPDGDTSLVTSRYGVEWRCWTARPDEKRRADTPWN